MIKICEVCSERYTDPHRGWYDDYILRTCSSSCFRKLLTDIVEDGVSAYIKRIDDPKISKFRTPFSFDLRSGYEREFRQWLRRYQIAYLYEPYSFTFDNKRRYVPDFLINDGVFIEIKGEWTSEGKGKFQQMSLEYDWVNLWVIDRQFLDMLKKTPMPSDIAKALSKPPIKYRVTK